MTTIEHNTGEGAPVPEALTGGKHLTNFVGYQAGSARARNGRVPPDQPVLGIAWDDKSRISVQ